MCMQSPRGKLFHVGGELLHSSLYAIRIILGHQPIRNKCYQNSCTTEVNWGRLKRAFLGRNSIQLVDSQLRLNRVVKAESKSMVGLFAMFFVSSNVVAVSDTAQTEDN